MQHLLFFPSPFERAAILTIDGVGEWTTTSYGTGLQNRVDLTHHIRFPHSLGLLYSAFTYYTGFKINSGEYKVMGLAPYGDRASSTKYAQLVYDNILDLREDGSLRLNLDYFNYCQGLTMTNERFHRLFGGQPRKPEEKLTQRHMDLATALQIVTEEAMFRLAKHVRKMTGEKNLCMSGGVALNCVGNGKIIREGVFEKYFFQPAAGDAGGALGTALFLWYQFLNKPRFADNVHDVQKASLLGPSYTNEEIRAYLQAVGAKFHAYDSWEPLLDRVVELLQAEKVIGFCQGRMEFGPRALGSRSILGDARSTNMQTTMNLKIKFRESFRPFAPIVMEECMHEYFDLEDPSPYMLRVGYVRPERRIPLTPEQEKLFGIEKLKIPRSDIPAITHVDYSARIQTVDQGRNPIVHRLLQKFREKTGYGILVNTSFNVRGEPIICSPQDAYRCFMNTEMDVLVVENNILYKEEQTKAKGDQEYIAKFQKMDLKEDDAQGHGFRSPKQIWRDPTSAIREFGSIFCIGLFVIGLFLQWKASHWTLTWDVFATNASASFGWWLVGGIVGTLAVIAPPLVRPLYWLWIMFGQCAGWLMQRLILGTLYYAVFAPVGWLYRRWCKVITKKADTKLSTYWESKHLAEDQASYYRQF